MSGTRPRWLRNLTANAHDAIVDVCLTAFVVLVVTGGLIVIGASALTPVLVYLAYGSWTAYLLYVPLAAFTWFLVFTCDDRR